MSTDPRYARRVAELIDRLSRLTRELQYVHGLNPAQWEALRFIARANRYSRTPGALAEFLGATKGTTSQTLISLENRGFVRRLRNAADRRVVNLELTEAAEELLLDDPVLKIEKMAGHLDADAGDLMVRTLSRLLGDMQREVGAKTFGVCARCARIRCSDGADGAVSNHCGLTGEPISEIETNQICVHFQSVDAKTS